jgi:hypothetical protein
VSTSRVIGVPWYRAEDYGRLRQMVSDPHAMAPAYEAWRASAENNEQVARDAGLTIVRVIVEPDAFAAWCTERHLVLDGGARIRFATEMAQER